MTSTLSHSDDSRRLLLALLLALGLHGVVLLGMPVHSWLRASPPERIALRLLPPVIRPTVVPVPPAPEVASIEPPTPAAGVATPPASPKSPDSVPTQGFTPDVPRSLPPPTQAIVAPAASVKPAVAPAGTPRPKPKPAITSAVPAVKPPSQARLPIAAKPAVPKPTDAKPITAKPMAAKPMAAKPMTVAKKAVVPARKAPPPQTARRSREDSAAVASAPPRAPTFPDAADTPLVDSEVMTPVQPAPVRRRVPPVRPLERAARPGRLDSSALLGQVAGLDAPTRQQATTATRSKRVNPNDMHSSEGFYIASWVRKVEQIGEMNFPAVARTLELTTGPVLDVAIRANGSLQAVRVVRSSGNAELDQAAQRIVRLGAPYAAFPPGLRQQYDVLHITRPWRFDPGGRVRAR